MEGKPPNPPPRRGERGRSLNALLDEGPKAILVLLGVPLVLLVVVVVVVVVLS